MESSSTSRHRLPADIVDPHFHVWHLDELPNPNLGDLASKVPTYLLSDYLQDGQGLHITGGVHIEAVVGQAKGQASLDPLKETQFVLRQIEQCSHTTSRRINIVAFVHLEKADAQDVIEAHLAHAGHRLVGVRMILNYSATDPTLTWPQVETGNFLTGTNQAFNKGFGLLSKFGLSFDLQVNWFQLSQAAEFLIRYPDTIVVVDHLGCLKLDADEDENQRRETVWREGMRALARLPNVYMKLSMLEYVKSGWQMEKEAYAIVKRLVREAISLFSTSRVMFASNFPVDRCMGGTSLRELYTSLHSLVDDMEEIDVLRMFSGTAAIVYKL